MKKINLFWAVVLFAIIGIAIYWQLSRPRTTTHLHGNETLEDHVHTHRGPFSHDHYHVGIRDGTTHSHPHSHPEEHLEVPKSLLNWIVVGHVHGDDKVSMFYAKCQLEDHRLIVRFQRQVEGSGAGKYLIEGGRVVGKLYFGHKLEDSFLFELEEGSLVSKSLPDLNLGPRSTLVIENLDVESSEFSVVLPVSNATDHSDLAN